MPRPLTPKDLDSIDALRPSEWPPFRATFERYFRLPCCTPYGIEREGRLVAMGTLIAFGSSGWIAQLISAPDLRGQGLGTQMLTFLMAESRRRTMNTLSLIATDLGFPLYQKAGFRVEGEYGFWSRTEGPAPAEPQASLQLTRDVTPRANQWSSLDRQVSGEDRSAYTRDGLSEGWSWDRGGSWEGAYLPRIGEGLVIARTQRAGVALLHRRLDGAARCVVPLENAWARPVLESRGFTPQSQGRRMVWGASLVRRPEWVWSRIGGNLG